MSINCQRRNEITLRQEGNAYRRQTERDRPPSGGQRRSVMAKMPKVNIALLARGGTSRAHCCKHSPPDGGRTSRRQLVIVYDNKTRIISCTV